MKRTEGQRQNPKKRQLYRYKVGKGRKEESIMSLGLSCRVKETSECGHERRDYSREAVCHILLRS